MCCLLYDPMVAAGSIGMTSCNSVVFGCDQQWPLLWLSFYINELRDNLRVFCYHIIGSLIHFPFLVFFFLSFFLKQALQRCWPWQLWVQLQGSHSQRFPMWRQWTFLFQFASFLCLLPWWNMAHCTTLPATEKETKEKKRRQNLSHQ